MIIDKLSIKKHKFNVVHFKSIAKLFVKYYNIIMNILSIIEKKKLGKKLTSNEIQFFVVGAFLRIRGKRTFDWRISRTVQLVTSQ